MAKNDSVKIKIDKIKVEINKYNNFYYDKNISKISDLEYDSLVQDLIELESKNPHLIEPDSPTQKVSGLINEQFKQYEHMIPMLSLNNAFSYDDLYAFDRRIKKSINKKIVKYFCEYKVDGLSISLIYKNGKLIKAATRGDGEFGEDITNNVLQIYSVPKTIDYKNDLIVRGEIFLKKEQFNVLNLERIQKKHKIFANPRNAASGTIRQLNSKIVKERNLSIFCYFVNTKNSNETQDEDIIFLKNNNFPINNDNKLLNSIEEVIEYVKVLEEKRNNLDYEVDGIVIKVNKYTYQKEIGETSKFPKWASAYKFEATRKLTILKDIFPSVGRTGKITYNAVLNPVTLCGTNVKSATLHNAEYIIKNDIRIGDYVWVKKAGDIIPKVIKPDITKRTKNLVKWLPSNNCIECNQILIRKKHGVDFYCININCHKQLLRQIEHFVSKKAMNIKGVSIKFLEKLYDLKLLNNFTDLFKLKKYENEILKIDKIGQKTFDNILNSIENSKKVSLDKFIYSLGISNIGSYNSTILANHFKSIHKFLHINPKELKELNDIGPIISNSLFEYFSNKNNKNLIKELIKLGINIYYEKVSKKFNNNIFVFTGKLLKPRVEYTNRIKKLGGHISSIVSSKTTYLIIGEHPGSKFIKAESLNIEIINEEDLEKLLKG